MTAAKLLQSFVHLPALFCHSFLYSMKVILAIWQEIKQLKTN